MKKMINKVLLSGIGLIFITGCNSGGNSSSKTQDGAEQINMSVKRINNTLPTTAQRVNGPQFAYTDTVNNYIYYRESSNAGYVTIPVVTEVKNALASLPKERIDYDYNSMLKSRTAIIYGDEEYLNNREVYIITSTDGGISWNMTHRFTPTNLTANPIHSEGTLYSATASNNLVAIQSDGTQAKLLGNDCDGSATTLLKRAHNTKDINNLYSNILIATEHGSICSYNVKSHKLDKLVSGNGIAITKITVNILGTMFAYISKDGTLRINEISGKNIATYNQNSFDYAYNPSDISFTPNRDLVITKVYNIGGNKFFSTAKWKFKSQHLTAAKYHTFDGEVYNYIPNALASNKNILSFWGDFAAVAIGVVEVAAIVTVAVVAPEAAPELVDATIDVVDVERSASSTQMLLDALDLQF